MNRVKNILLDAWKYAPGACCALAYTVSVGIGLAFYIRYFAAHALESVAVPIIVFLFSVLVAIRAAMLYDLTRTDDL